MRPKISSSITWPSARSWPTIDPICSVFQATIEETLATFHTELEEKFKRINRRIENGENKHIKITGTGDKRRWTLIYPSEEESINSPFWG